MAEMSESRTGVLARAEAEGEAEEAFPDDERFAGAGSSARVFHAPHAGHCPCQRGVSLPQSVQKKTVRSLGMRQAASCRSENDSKRVHSLRKNSSIVPVGPFRCLEMMSSAFPVRPFSWASMSPR